MSLNGWSRSFAMVMARCTLIDESSTMLCSISTTAWLAPPWRGPHSAFIPAATAANRFAWLEPTKRTVAVEQFCP